MRLRVVVVVMSTLGHYGIHAGDTNNKYYNTDGGQRAFCRAAPSIHRQMQHIVKHVALMTVLLLRKKFYHRPGSELCPVPSVLLREQNAKDKHPSV